MIAKTVSPKKMIKPKKITTPVSIFFAYFFKLKEAYKWQKKNKDTYLTHEYVYEDVKNLLIDNILPDQNVINSRSKSEPKKEK